MKRLLFVFLLVNLVLTACVPVSAPMPTAAPTSTAMPLPTSIPIPTPTETPIPTPTPTETPIVQEQIPKTTAELTNYFAEKFGGGIEWSMAEAHPQYFNEFNDIVLTETFGGEDKSMIGENPLWIRKDPSDPEKPFRLLSEAMEIVTNGLNQLARDKGFRIHYLVTETGELQPTTAPFKLKEGEEIAGVVHIFTGPPHNFPYKYRSPNTLYASEGIAVAHSPEDPTKIIIFHFLSMDEEILCKSEVPSTTSPDYPGNLALQKILGWLVNIMSAPGVYAEAAYKAGDLGPEEEPKYPPLPKTPLIFFRANQ